MDGYTADMYQAWWRRATMRGLPHRWFAVWFVAMVLQSMAGAVLAAPYGWWLGVCGALLGFGLACAELALLAWCMRMDPHCDAVNVDRWRYRPHYEAD